MYSDVLWKLTGILVVILGAVFGGIPPRSPQESYYCTNRLETALEQIVRRTRTVSGSRSYLELSPYSIYHSLYGGEGAPSGAHQLSEKLDNFPGRKELPVTKVEVAELRVRLPQNSRWVHVDKCQFSNVNRTLDTRLVFPDLTISGRILLHPIGGACSMILRLRHAGIEFRTIPLTSNEEARRSGSASVRTDSHFSEPGFLSVFAHGCRKNPTMKFRHNSKMRNIEKRLSHNYEEEDIINFRDKIIDSDPENARTFSEIFGGGYFDRKPFVGAPGYGGTWQNVQNYQNHPNNRPQHLPPEEGDSEEIFSDSMQRQLEQLFSMGVRSLLTSYMQKALQPAIKETLMENMGYTLSYG